MMLWNHVPKCLATLALLAFLLSSEVSAQCAMCKAVAEDSMQDGYGTAMGLNSGIMLIMFVPYALLGVLFFTFFGSRIKEFLKDFSRIHSA